MKSSPAASASIQPTDKRLRGYAEIFGASLILGSAPALLQASTMPASLLLVLRMGLAGIVLGVVFFLTGGIEEVRRSGRFWRLVLIGVVVAGELMTYFAAVRLANVTIGIALEYMAPVYVAFFAPWVFHNRRDRIDMYAVIIAVGGLALILAPSLTLAGKNLLPGIISGILAGGLYAAALMLMKGVGRTVRGSTITLFHCICTVILITPLAVWQTSGSGYRLTWTDAGIVLIMGLVYTALCFTLFIDGMRYVRVEHAGILGYIEPVTAPLWAFLLVGETPALTSLAGGVLIICAGVLVVLFGKAEAEPLA
jgi:drug/metabolite transporter (DMT)-like permease